MAVTRVLEHSRLPRRGLIAVGWRPFPVDAMMGIP